MLQPETAKKPNKYKPFHWVRIPDDLWKLLLTVSNSEGRTVTNLIVLILREAMETEEI